VLTGGIVAAWGLDKAVLSLCAARICRLVLAVVVRDEVEANLIEHAAALPAGEANELLKGYETLIELMRPELIPPPRLQEVAKSRHIIRHAADVPVLLSAISCRPDCLLTHNTRHFSAAVARNTRLRIATPALFFKTISRGLG